VSISKIEWTDYTFNPWWGCARVSPACRSCYADTLASRYGFNLWRRHGDRLMLSDNHWRKPHLWNRKAEADGRRKLVFCASMADVFEDRRDLDEPRRRLWQLIGDTPWLTWQLLTKRPENVSRLAPWTGQWPGNVWLGVSAENQRFADQRIPYLVDIPVAVRFVSAEPLLGFLDLWPWLSNPSLALNYNQAQPLLRWVITGGESGSDARALDLDLVRTLRDQCAAADVPLFTKQLGSVWARRNGHRGKGNNIADWPEDLRIRQMPEPAVS
jgi:protein gp37